MVTLVVIYYRVLREFDMRIGKTINLMYAITSIIVLMLSLSPSAGAAQDEYSSTLPAVIKNIVSGSDDILHLDNSEDLIYVRKMLRRFYARKNYLPAWNDNGKISKKADSLIEAIEEISNQGLVPEYYHLEAIRDLMEKLRVDKVNLEELAMLDVLLSDAFLMLGCHLSAGCVNPVTVEAEWFLDRTDLAVDVVLEDALEGNNLNESLSFLLPPQAEYFRLMNTLNQYRKIAAKGGWSIVNDEKILEVGDRNESVAKFKERLLNSGDLKHLGDENVFNEDIETAVVRFQKRHGLKTDGIVGTETFRALNVPVDQRVKQIEVNLERMRWASRSLGHRYIVVNIADYNLRVIEHNETVMTMEVVVGRPYWDTPVFSEKMLYLVLNPSWKVPTSIVRREILPKIKKSPDYLASQGFQVVNGWMDDAEEIDWTTIDWAGMTAGSFKYKIRQAPGPLNPLGRIKFMMPNKFNIYLHDTPARELFSRNSRAFSHGCIRVKSPVELAIYLLQDDTDWTHENVMDAMEKGEELKIELQTPINVHVLYLTSWVDEEGILNFRDDIYGRDKRLYRAMKDMPIISTN